MGLGLSRRTRIAIIALFAMGFVIFLPMRIALGMAGLERLGVAAREVRGTVWSGGVDRLMLGPVPLGSVPAALYAPALLAGRGGEARRAPVVGKGEKGCE